MPPRSLTLLERQPCIDALLAVHVAAPEVCRRAVHETRLFARRPTLSEIRGPASAIAHIALSSRADGITLGRDVFIRRALFTETGGLPLSLVGHEVAHVAQVLERGPVSFYTRYVAQYLRGRARGLSDRDAYLQIPFEVEAREVGALLRR